MAEPSRRRADRAGRRRSPGDRIGRAALAAGAVLAGVQGVTFSLAQAAAERSPVLAVSLAPYDGRIAGRAAEMLAGSDASTADRRQADALAVFALRREPTAVPAVAALGINAAVRGDTTAARHSFAYAERLSRRHATTQLWAIEDAVSRGDVPAALRHYDTALRVSPKLFDTLFPVLGQAANEPAVRTALVRVLAARPPWGANFVGHLSEDGREPVRKASLFDALGHAGIPVPASARARVVDALIADGKVDRAWSFYQAGRPARVADTDRLRSRDPDFGVASDTTGASSRFDWTILPTNAVVASMGDGRFEFSAPPSVGGPVLRQLQLLPPGHYRLSGQATGVEGASPYWSLVCLSGRELGRLAVPVSGQADARFSKDFTVPEGCRVQELTLILRPSDAIGGLSGRIIRTLLAPASAMSLKEDR